MQYKIEFTAAASRGLRNAPRVEQVKIGRKIDLLANTPRPSGCKKLVNAEGLYRIRIGDYRVIYSVNDELISILVVRIGNRRDIYK